MNWKNYNPPSEAVEVLANCPKVTVASTIAELVDLACGGPESNSFEVAYDIPGKGRHIEANVVRVRNGVSANYTEAYMRRRDPNCMLIADDLPTDKVTYKERFGEGFDTLRAESFAWLKTQELAMFSFMAGQPGMGMHALAIVPANAGFFALGLAMLQGIIPHDELPDDFTPKAVIYTIPPFRHTHFDGKQVVVHDRQHGLYEMFSYNLYPGPSAKKGVYGMLLDMGEQADEGWVTAHASTVQVVTPYDLTVTIMHEGASGGGKSEMLEQPHREHDGRILLGENIQTDERRHLEIPRTCELLPVTDDMALCHPSLQGSISKLVVTDAENAWFLRVNHINQYGVDPQLERLTTHPAEPLLFLNIDAVTGGRALIWEHIQDAPGKPCPNPRVIVPRNLFPGVVNDPVNVDVRSFGVRTPPCTREKPTYGIMGLFHILPPSLAWLWRLVAPRGHNNPSIVDQNKLTSEGVGSYWPFAVGERVQQANLLLQQFTEYSRTRYVLCPNQHVGAWHVGFTPQWIAREYLARRGGAKFKPEKLIPSRSSLLGYTLPQLHVEGRSIGRIFMHVEAQPEVGEEGYDKGEALLYDFFREYLADFASSDLDPLGRQIIECCLDNGTVKDYEAFIPMEY
jgi:hypothetical protein